MLNNRSTFYPENTGDGLLRNRGFAGIDSTRAHPYRMHTMRNRLPRVRAPAGFPATLSGRPYNVVDISITGALGILDEQLEFRSIHALRLGADPDFVDVDARVVRATRAGDWWAIAIDWTSSAKATPQQIGALLTRLTRGIPS